MDPLCHFINRAPTAYHAAVLIEKRCRATPLRPDEPWKLKRGETYSLRQGGTIALFTLPKKKPKRGTLLFAHTDSPALKLKPNPEVYKEGATLLSTELYGAPILATWVSRDLALAGRVVLKDKKGKLKEELVHFEHAPVILPPIALHLDRQVNEKGLTLDKQKELMPLCSLSVEKGYLKRLLKKPYYTFDLILVPMEEARAIGEKKEMIAGYRLDNLLSCFACVEAFEKMKGPLGDALQLVILFDHEEIGSRSATGALSTFTTTLLERIAESYEMTREELAILKQHLFCLSLDVAHGFHPSYPDKYDPNHEPKLGDGIVIKFNGDLRYASTPLPAARLMQRMDKLRLPYQLYTNRANLPSGSTVGPLLAAELGIEVVDCGTPLLSMHSAREVAAFDDVATLTKLLTSLLSDVI